MPNPNRDAGLLSEVLPSSLLAPDQVAHGRNGEEMPTYKLLRTPENIHELARYKHGMAIWRDNGTLAYVNCRHRDARAIYLEFR